MHGGLQEDTGHADPGWPAEMLFWFGDVPGCQVRPSPDSDEDCGDPAEDMYLCVIEHSRWCPVRTERIHLWMCEHHLECTIEGRMGCVPCGGIVEVEQVV